MQPEGIQYRRRGRRCACSGNDHRRFIGGPGEEVNNQRQPQSRQKLVEQPIRITCGGFRIATGIGVSSLLASLCGITQCPRFGICGLYTLLVAGNHGIPGHCCPFSGPSGEDTPWIYAFLRRSGSRDPIDRQQGFSPLRDRNLYGNRYAGGCIHMECMACSESSG